MTNSGATTIAAGNNIKNQNPEATEAIEESTLQPWVIIVIVVVVTVAVVPVIGFVFLEMRKKKRARQWRETMRKDAAKRRKRPRKPQRPGVLEKCLEPPAASSSD